MRKYLLTITFALIYVIGLMSVIYFSENRTVSVIIAIIVGLLCSALAIYIDEKME